MDEDVVDERVTLSRWEDAGGTWRVVGRSSASLTIGLCRCDGGEEVDRLVVSDPVLVSRLRGRESSEDQVSGAD